MGFAKTTNTGLLQITKYIRAELDKGKAVGLVALDLSKAFDTIDHTILLNKLRTFNLGNSILSFLKNYLSNRTLIVKHRNETSSMYTTSRGVPQGSILGPLLFTLYVNDLPTVIKDSQAVLYADDTTMFTSSRFPSNIQVNLASDIKRAERWLIQNNLKLNVGKTEYMLITNNRVRERFNNIKVKVGNSLITEKDKIKILGVTLSNNLTWEAHTNVLVKNLKYCFRGFSGACRLLTTDSKKLLYNAAISSRLNYCDSIWDNCGVRNRIQTIQNRCARRILCQKPGTTAAPLLKELGWLTLAKKRKLHKCVLMHKLLKGEGPDKLLEMLEPLKHTAEIATRATTNNNLWIPAHNTNYMSYSYIYDAARLWNTIPLKLKQIKNSRTFKENLHLYLLTN